VETTPPDACHACGGEEGAGVRNGTARPRLHCTEDLCHANNSATSIGRDCKARTAGEACPVHAARPHASHPPHGANQHSSGLAPPTERWPGNHLVSKGKPWSRKRSRDRVATNSTTGDNGPFRPNGHGRAQEEAPPPTMVAIKTPPPIPGESAPANCRRQTHGGGFRRSEKLLRVTGSDDQ
jgi:hypothetical protein